MNYKEKLSHREYNQKEFESIGLLYKNKNVKKIPTHNRDEEYEENFIKRSIGEKHDKSTRLKSCYTNYNENRKDEDSDKYCNSETNSSGMKKGQKLLKHFEDVFEKYLNEEFESRNSYHKREEPTIEKLIDNGNLYKLTNMKKVIKTKKLTEEQKQLIEMDKPPLDKLKHIPIKFLKPRVPSRLMTKNPVEISKLNEINIEMKKCSEEYLKPSNYSDIDNFDEPEPYLHPNIEKMFARETTEKLMRPQEETNIDTETNKLQNKLLKEMQTDRKSPFVLDLKTTKDENWREVLAQQEKTNLLPCLKEDQTSIYCSGISKFDQSTDRQDKEILISVDPNVIKLEKVEEPNVKNLDPINRCKEPSFGGGDTNLYSHKIDETQKQKIKEIFNSIINSNLKEIDFLGCLHIMETITYRMELNIFSKSTKISEEGDRQMIDHLRQIQREIISLKNFNQFVFNQN